MGKKKTEYERVRDVWYKRLKLEGFVDIEYEDGSIASGVPRSLAGLDPELREYTHDYYSMAQSFLDTYEFETEVEKVIWDYHANGLSIREISKVLTDVGMENVSKTVVGRTIQRLDKIMRSMYVSK